MPDVFAAEEAARLAALAEYGLLDTPPEDAIDRIARLAAHIFDAPVALVSLVAGDRQYFKARVGVEPPELPLDWSFCKHTILSNDAMIVLDTLTDPRFATHPMVTGDAPMRFYAGVPLTSPTGRHFGALCVFDRRPRADFGPRDQATLRSLGALVMDHFEIHRLHRARKAGRTQFESAASTSPDAIICVDEAGRISFWNDGAQTLFGYATDAVLGEPVEILIAGADRLQERGRLLSMAEAHASDTHPAHVTSHVSSHAPFEFMAMRGNGTAFPVALSFMPFMPAQPPRDGCGGQSGIGDANVGGNAHGDQARTHRRFGALIRDMTRRSETEADLYRQASIDRLTDMVDRDAFAGHLTVKIAAGLPLDLLLIDFHNFKIINDTWGHATGDRVIEILAHRVRRVMGDVEANAQSMSSRRPLPLFPSSSPSPSLRRSQFPTIRHVEVPLLGRLSGDAFAVTLPSYPAASVSASRASSQGSMPPKRIDIGEVCRRLIASLNEAIDIDGQGVSVNASVGVASFPDDALTAENLLSNADLALYQAKADGPNVHRFFVPALRQAVVERRIIERELCIALERGQLELFYQPQVDLISRKVLGAEALLRWRHPARGLLSPSDFIDVLETSSIAAAVGQCIIETACAQAASWRASGAKDFQMSVNLFGRQIISGNLFASVMEPIRRHGLPARAIEIEITETTILRRDDILLTPLRELCKEGVRIAFDDYGTGYASLSLLKNFPLTRLKIDKSFVENLEEDKEDAAVVQAILYLAKSFGLRVIAEGVETEAQARVLIDQGCREAQGYLYGRPVPPREFEATFLPGLVVEPLAAASLS